MINLRFGIPSLDAILVGKTEREAEERAHDIDWGGILLSEKSEGTSVCLIGPDGTGKSVFSMHLAAQYLWDCREIAKGTKQRVPKFIYISTDLRHEMAERVFANFHLDRPVWARSEVDIGRATLRKLTTGDVSDLAEFLLSDSDDEIGFVDLASDTAGDDWALVTRIVSLLEDQERESGLRHLLVIDAVEGLETLAGETDAYGQKVSRRARIALLMRLASHKCHLALVVEETKTDIRLPEEFVADIVIRLRSTLTNSYTRRTLEIEKARGQAHHARGQHPFQIRSGKHVQGKPGGESPEGKAAHVIVYPSLHYQGNSIRESMKHPGQNENQTDTPLVSFGIRHLDGLLKRIPHERFGLPAGLPFALVGDKGTFKSHIADAFLASCFADIAAGFIVPEKQAVVWRSCWAGADESAGVAILASSKPRSRSDLDRAITRQLLDSNSRAREVLMELSENKRQAFHQWMCDNLADRIQLDTLVIQDQPGPRLFHRIDELIHNASRALERLPAMGDQNHRIRIVFDDLTGFRDAYPELHEDPLLLPLVIQLCRLKRISTLLVATQPTHSDERQLLPFDSAVRSLVDGYLLTWRVSFFGEARTAITFVAGSQANRQPTIREVCCRPLATHKDILVTEVDPEFELYDGLETGHPQPVPLEVRLYLETPAITAYVLRENQLLCEVFSATSNATERGAVLTGVGPDAYDALRDYCYLSASSKLRTTLLLQVDEFWRPAKGLGMFVDLKEYVSTPVDSVDTSDPYEDQYELFRLSDQGKEVTDPQRADEYPMSRTRRDFFPEFRRPGPPRDAEVIDRVPFMWDFGFLLLSHNDWYSSFEISLPILSQRLWASICDRSGWVDHRWPGLEEPRGKPLLKESDSTRFTGITIGTVLEALRKPTSHLRVRSEQLAQGDREGLAKINAEGKLFRGPSSWRAVLEAAAEVRRRRIARDTTVVKSFDLARPSAESFSGLVLEIWFSEILERASWRMRNNPDSGASVGANAFLGKVSSFNSREQYCMEELLKEFRLELYMTWMLLVEVLDFENLVDRDQRFSLKVSADPTPAMATRHWYKTAALAEGVKYSEEPALPVRLPGYFSTRGDWYLAMAAGSRSYRLGTRALDLLNSRRANITRLQDGIGLPVRDIVHPRAFRQFRTRLSYVNYRGRRATVDYGALIGLGAESTRSWLCSEDRPTSPDPQIDTARSSFSGIADSSNSFFWLWRSRIRGYDRHARIWAKWLVRVALLMQGIKNEQAAVWRNGFDVYDDIALSEMVPSGITELRSYKRFSGMVDFLIDELQWASVAPKE